MRASQIDRQGRMTNVSDAVHLQPAGDASPRPAKPTARQPAGVSQPTRKPDGPMKRLGQALVWVVVVLALGGGGYYAWLKLRPPGLPEGFASGNGRIEGTEIDVDAKIPGRIAEILVDEGGFVSAGQVLVHMDTKTLEAQRREAEAQLERAKIGVETAESVVRQREAERTAATAQIATRKALWDAAASRLARVEPMAAKDFETKQSLDDARAAEHATNSAIAEAQANLAASEAGISAAKAQIVDAKAAVIAAQRPSTASSRTSTTRASSRRGTAGCSSKSLRKAKCCRPAGASSTSSTWATST